MAMIPTVTEIPSCPQCGASEARDVIAALGVCQSCVTVERIDDLMGVLLRRSLPATHSPMRILLDYIRESRRKAD